MGLVTCGGADVIRGRIHFPFRGAWYSELELDTPSPPSGQVTIEADQGLNLSGTVTQSGAFLDASHVRVVGGAGGLGVELPPAAYQNCLLRDPLNAVMAASGESLSSTVEQSILNVFLFSWTHAAQRVTEALDWLCFAAGEAIGEDVGWRIMSDGAIWVGSETWPSESIPDNSDILEAYPSEKRFELGVQTPSLMPGVALDQVGNVKSVDHWLGTDRTVTDLWL